jgi:hypothetical protein
MHKPIGSENDTANGLHWYAAWSRSSPTAASDGGVRFLDNPVWPKNQEQHKEAAFLLPRSAVI